MAFDESKYEKIDRYLNQELEGEELQQFEQAMQQDQDLAQEVELNSDMNEYLSDSPENALRKSLMVLGENASIDEIQDGQADTDMGSSDASGSSLNYLWVLVPIIGLATWWMMSSGSSTESTVADNQELKVVPTAIVEEEPAPIAPPQEEPVEVEVPEKSAPVPPPKKKAPIKKKAPAPKPFDANPTLDLLVGDLAGKMQRLRTRTRVGAFTNNSPTTKVTLNLDGELESKEDLNGHPFRFYLYSNNTSDFKNKKAIRQEDLNLQSIGNNFYQLNFEVVQQLREGLYYYVVEDQQSKKIIAASKFEIEKL